MKCWRTFKLKAQKHFFELFLVLCPFRPGKGYHTSSLPSPFTVVSITDQKRAYFIFFLLPPTSKSCDLLSFTRNVVAETMTSSKKIRITKRQVGTNLDLGTSPLV